MRVGRGPQTNGKLVLASVALTTLAVSLLLCTPCGAPPDGGAGQPGEGVARTALDSEVPSPAHAASRELLIDDVSRLRQLFRIDPRRSNAYGKFVGEYCCDDPRAPAQLAATEGRDGEGLTSQRWLAWRVAIRIGPDHTGLPLRVQWDGWTSVDMKAAELLEIFRNHDESNVHALGKYDAALSVEEILLGGAPEHIEVTLGGAKYSYRLDRR